jgi:hypothetical protein
LLNIQCTFQGRVAKEQNPEIIKGGTIIIESIAASLKYTHAK